MFKYYSTPLPTAQADINLSIPIKIIMFEHYVTRASENWHFPTDFQKKKIYVIPMLLTTITHRHTVCTNELLSTVVHKLRKCIVLDIISYKLNKNQ